MPLCSFQTWWQHIKLHLQITMEVTVTAASGDCVHVCCQVCLLPVTAFHKCVLKGGMVSKHRRVTGSEIALSITERGLFFSFFVLCDPLHDTVSACVRCPSKLQGITNTGSDRTSRTFQSSWGAKAAVQIKSLRDRPITIQQLTPSERHRERRGRGRRGRSVLHFQAWLSCCL